ncbi:MAG: hypothetical protein BAJALOKI3v1_30119 [Promethearchaeota archaeon]|nr:MAG: hypothetical protein BAJALOKI3v1_30119 [Candidatus Lokiarchaeota archaeon]
MSKDALKFFQSYVNEMIDVGGENLPKSISSRLGAKLAKIYKKAGICDIVVGLKKSYEVLKSIPEINETNENSLEVKIQYDECFCPIGGDPDPDNPEKGKIIQESICIPYTIGFLNEFNPNYNYDGAVEQCILSSGQKTCKYVLHRTLKEENNNNY